MDMTEHFGKRSLVNLFLVASLAGQEITDQLKATPRIVTMQINGVEVNSQHSLHRLEEEFYRAVEMRAKELVDEIRSEIFDPVDDLVRDLTSNLTSVINKKLDKFGLAVSQEE